MKQLKWDFGANIIFNDSDMTIIKRIITNIKRAFKVYKKPSKLNIDHLYT
jgi:hypothetical protein